jgi:diguanylate cyclase (GGDEF)-like protein
MSLDPATLIILTAVIAASVGVLLVFAWAQNRAHQALAMWGCVDLLGAVSIVLIMTRNHAPDVISITLPFALLTSAYALMWGACRIFSHRPLLPMWMAIGPAIWLVACAFPAFFLATELRVALVSAINVVYTLVATYELWRDRREHLLSRFPMIGCLILHAMFLIARGVIALAFGLPPSSQILATSLTAPITLETMFVIIAGGFLQLSMAKERSEAVQRRAAATDDLTGIASRRAFLSEGEQRLRAAARRGLPTALLLFDLDHFKQINDSHGHQTGDHVLQLFAKRTSEVLSAGDFFGRVGGEEFAVLLSDRGQALALNTAELVREAVEKIEFREQTMPLHLSVSVGVAIAYDSDCSLADLLKQADHALYEAKAAGRNRVYFNRSCVTPQLRIV